MMIFYESWTGIARVLITALVFYPFLVFSIKLAGKRSNSKLNCFDWIVTVAIGSIVGATILQKSVVVVEAAAGVAALLFLQYALTRICVQSDAVAKIVRSQPRLLMVDGTYFEDALIDERVLKEDVESAARVAGYSDLTDVGAVILETDASLSIIGKPMSKRQLVTKAQHRS